MSASPVFVGLHSERKQDPRELTTGYCSPPLTKCRSGWFGTEPHRLPLGSTVTWAESGRSLAQEEGMLPANSGGGSGDSGRYLSRQAVARAAAQAA